MSCVLEHLHGAWTPVALEAQEQHLGFQEEEAMPSSTLQAQNSVP